MIRFRSGETPPDWCELRDFSLHATTPQAAIRQTRQGQRERLLMTRGDCLVAVGDQAMVLRPGQFFDIPDGQDNWSAIATTGDAQFLRLTGNWGTEIAGCGLWTLDNDPDPADRGDPVDYPKQTRMDSHYHDCDEYWFILEGAATVVVSGQSEDVVAGDCIAIGAGHHHDMPQVRKTMRGAFFETTLIGRKRLGHLWNHTHGPASPRPGCL